MEMKTKKLSNLNSCQAVEFLPGIFRRTMSYNKANMLCHFTLKKNARIELHKHVACQNGFVIRGKVRFFTQDGNSFIVEDGDGYLFESEEYHGSEVLEDTELIECFSPFRPEYADTAV